MSELFTWPADIRIGEYTLVVALIGPILVYGSSTVTCFLCNIHVFSPRHCGLNNNNLVVNILFFFQSSVVSALFRVVINH